jgi:tryptophanyl-tRNA synthetase
VTREVNRKARVLSGMRPTGRLHIGHYFGALSNWLRMQEEYDCFYFVADWHALTTHYADSSQVASNTLEVATDWLAVGLDPAKATLFIQSSVPEHAELHLLLSMITPLSWLERVPTYKEQIENLRDKDLGTYGFLGYPLLQGADIAMYGEPGQKLMVPVGEDQAPHIEMTREIVGTFNLRFGVEIDIRAIAAPGNANDVNTLVMSLAGQKDYFPQKGSLTLNDATAISQTLRTFIYESGVRNSLERFSKLLGGDAILRKFIHVERILVEPDVILTETPRVPGTDGRRMAKSYGNAIWLTDTPDEIRAKAKNMMTDPQRVRKTDPGRPEVCPVFAYHNLFPEKKSAEDCARIERAAFNCRNAKWGCLDCKAEMAGALIKWIEPIQQRRAKYSANPQLVWEILEDGSRRAKKVAEQTMDRVRKAVFDWEGAGRRAVTSGEGLATSKPAQ